MLLFPDMTEKLKTIYHRDYGEVVFLKKPGLKRMWVAVVPFGAIRVSLPRHMDFRQALEFLEKKDSWIKKQLGKMAVLEKSKTIFREDTVFSTLDHRLVFERTDHGGLGASVDGDSIMISIPSGTDFREAHVQEFIRKSIEEAWREEAVMYLPQRLKQLAQAHGFKYNRVSIRNNRSRWGSCSAGNNISLNLHLMRLPRELSDYVLVHELVHTRYKNHGREYWRKLEECIGDARRKDKELKKYRTDIY